MKARPIQMIFISTSNIILEVYVLIHTWITVFLLKIRHENNNIALASPNF